MIVAVILAVPVLVLMQLNRAALTNPLGGATLGESGSIVFTPSTDQQDPMENPPHGINGEGAGNAWARESHYLTRENATRWKELDDGVVVDTQTPSQPRPGAIEVVAVGDSFTYGVGHTDPRLRWPETLERELNQRTSPGTFSVTRLARPGTSAYTHARWLETHRDLIRQADVVILGVVENDAVPHPNDGPACAQRQDAVRDACQPQTIENHPLYQACLNGKSAGALEDVTAKLAPGVAEKLLTSDCSVARFSAELNLPSANHASYDLPESPLGPVFAAAVQRMTRAAGGTPVYAAPLDMWRGRERHLNWPGPASPNPYRGPVTAQDVARAYTHYGIPTIPMPAATKTLTGAWNPNIEVHPGDAHPGSVLTLAYARDIADFVLQTLPKERIDTAQASVGSEPAASDTVVTAYLPSTAKVTHERRTAILTVTSGWPETLYDSVGPFTLAGTELPPQLAPCMALGRPHLHVDLNLSSPEPRTVTLTLNNGPEVDVFTVEYNVNNERVVRSAGRLTTQGSLTVNPTDSTPIASLLLAPKDHGGCPLDAAIELPDMTISATLS